MSEAAAVIEKLIPEAIPAARGVHGSPARTVAVCATSLLGALALALGGCATHPPKPTAQLVRASTLIRVAENDEAERYAAADLQRARDELSDARKAEADQNYDSARRLAENAAADADLAGARAASGKAQESADQVHRSLDTLRQQLQQSSAPPGNSGPGAGGPGRDQL